MVKTVLITGASSGIGRVTASAFIDDGWNVIATSRDTAMVLPGIENESLLKVRLDLSDADSIAAAVERAKSRFDAIHVVVNIAGIGLGGPLEGITLTQLCEHFEINVIGTVAVCQAAASHMRSTGGGLIINVSSLAGRAGLPFLAPYSASKFAIEGLTEALYYELRPFGIRVKLVKPVGVRTRFFHIGAENPAYLPTAENVRQMMVEGVEKAASPDRVAKVILAAANDTSDRLRYAATDAVSALRLHRLLPHRIWRKTLLKAFRVTPP